MPLTRVPGTLEAMINHGLATEVVTAGKRFRTTSISSARSAADCRGVLQTRVLETLETMVNHGPAAEVVTTGKKFPCSE